MYRSNAAVVVRAAAGRVELASWRVGLGSTAIAPFCSAPLLQSTFDPVVLAVCEMSRLKTVYVHFHVTFSVRAAGNSRRLLILFFHSAEHADGWTQPPRVLSASLGPIQLLRWSFLPGKRARVQQILIDSFAPPSWILVRCLRVVGHMLQPNVGLFRTFPNPDTAVDAFL